MTRLPTRPFASPDLSVAKRLEAVGQCLRIEIGSGTAIGTDRLDR
jgi:hypothetical protein